MNRIHNWEEFRARGGRQNRLRLSDDEWESMVLALACEGNLLSHIQGIMTAGHDREMRIKWDIGEGTDPKWNKAQRDQAKAAIWEFFHDDIVSMYTRMAPNGIVNSIKLKTGFVLPESTMLNQLRAWNVPITGRGGGPSVARVTRPTNSNGRATTLSSVPTATRPGPSSPQPNLLSRDLLGAETKGNETARPFEIPKPDPTLAPPQPEPSVLDTSTSLELLIQQIEASRDEVQDCKKQMQEQDRKHDLETKTQNENHERVLTMAKQHARMADETKAQLARLQWDLSQIQENNTVLRAEVTNRHNAHQKLRATIGRQEYELRDLRQSLDTMQTTHSRLLGDFESLETENLNLKDQKLEDQRINQVLMQHIHAHAIQLQNILPSFSSGLNRVDVHNLVHSLKNPALQEDHPTSKDSGFFSGGRTNSKHLSVGSQNRSTNPKRPRHDGYPPPMGRSVSAQQHENHSLSHTTMAQRPLTEPRNPDIQSMMGRNEDQFIEPVAPVAAGEELDFELFLNMSEDHTVIEAQGGGWGDASPFNAQHLTPLDNLDGVLQSSTAPNPPSSGPPWNFIFGSSR